MSSTTEFEPLLKERAQLKRILQSMEEEEKYLGKRLRIIEEKIEIQVLKEKIKAKRAVVEQLKSKIENLEKRLKEPKKERIYGSDGKSGSSWQPIAQKTQVTASKTTGKKGTLNFSTRARLE